jgi:SAM-dependent methyltransferase
VGKVEPSFDTWRDRRGLFGNEVSTYDDGRPGYPEALYKLLADVCGLRRGSEVVEIGPGTGQVTQVLLELGASVLAVELSEPLAARLSEKFIGRDLTVVVSALESAELAPSSCDLFVAATSFHWIPPDVGLACATAALRPGGWLALWWNYFGDPNRPDPFHEALQPLLRTHAPELATQEGSGAVGAHPYALDSAARINEINAQRAYGPVQHEVIAWTGKHTPRQLRAMFGSFSPWLAIEPQRRHDLLDRLEHLAQQEFGDHVERPYLTSAYVAKRDHPERSVA